MRIFLLIIFASLHLISPDFCASGYEAVASMGFYTIRVNEYLAAYNDYSLKSGIDERIIVDNSIPNNFQDKVSFSIFTGSEFAKNESYLSGDYKSKVILIN